MPKGFDLRCAAGKTARVWLQGARGKLATGQAIVLLPPKARETAKSLGGYLAPLRQALIDNNSGHVSVVVCKSDYYSLKRGIKNLPPPPHLGTFHPVACGKCRRRNPARFRVEPEKAFRTVVSKRWRRNICLVCFDVEAEKAGVRYRFVSVEAMSWSECRSKGKSLAGKQRFLRAQ